MALLDRIRQIWHLNSADALNEEQTSGLASLHQEIGTHPARGLTPPKLASIMEAAQTGDMLAQCDLFADMEERDGHLFSELSKRRRSVMGLDWSLAPPRQASDAEKTQTAKLESLLRDTLDIETLVWELTDAIGKGFACLEIDWQQHHSEWQMATLNPRPQRWFTVPPDDRNDLRLRDNRHPNGAELWPLGWIVHRHAATSGYLPENALFRVLAWPYLFKHYSVRDLAEFLEIYGLPLRLGKFPPGATKKEKATLMKAVMNIGHSAGGIIPQNMEIDFQAAADGRQDPFLAMMNWAEATISKAIVGQTLTASSGSNGEGSRALGEVHDKVRWDITVSDAKQLQGTLTDQVVKPLGVLNGLINDPDRTPRFVFNTQLDEDLRKFSLALPRLVKVGMQVPVHWAHDKLSIPMPADDEPVLEMVQDNAGGPGFAPMRAALKAAGKTMPADQQAVQLTQTTQPMIGAWLEKIESILDEADSVDEARAMLAAAFDDLDADDFTDELSEALLAAEAAGRFDTEQQSGG